MEPGWLSPQLFAFASKIAIMKRSTVLQLYSNIFKVYLLKIGENRFENPEKFPVKFPVLREFRY
jgi:hypothetical protein